MLCRSGGLNVDEAIAQLEGRIQEYNELCSLRSHDSTAPMGREQVLADLCRTCAARYRMVLQQAKSKAGLSSVGGDVNGEAGEAIAPVTLGKAWKDAAAQAGGWA